MKLKNKKKGFNFAKRLNIIRESSMNIYNTNFLYGLYLQYYFSKTDWNKKLLNRDIILIENKSFDDNLELKIFKINRYSKIYLLIKDGIDIGYLSCINNYLEDIFLKSNYIGKNYSKYLLKSFIREKKNEKYDHIIFYTTNLTKFYKILKDKINLKILSNRKFFYINQMVISCNVNDFYNIIKDL